MDTYSFMRNVTYKLLFSLLGFIFILNSCHRKNSISKTETTGTTIVQPAKPLTPVAATIDPNVKALLTQLKNNEINFKELSLKLKTKVSSPDLNQSFTTNIRWKKNEKIWLSMSIIGIEGARVLITKDSIKIMDKINNRYVLKPLSYIKQKTLVDLSFSDIEHLLLGQLIFLDTAKAKFADNPANITINADAVRFLTNVVFDKTTKNPTSLFVTDKKYPQTIDVKYSNYQIQLGKPFAMDRELKMKNNTAEFEMIAKIQSIEVKQNMDYPFTINPSYKIEK